MTTLLLPGDCFGLGAAPWAGDKLPVSALSACVLLEATSLQQIVRLRSPSHSRLIEACKAASWTEQACVLNQIMRLSTLSGYERVAHMLSELRCRLRAVDLARTDTIEIPMTQSAIASILGLSGIHLNRTVRSMRDEGLLEIGRSSIRFLDPARLASIAGFSETSLVYSR